MDMNQFVRIIENGCIQLKESQTIFAVMVN